MKKIILRSLQSRTWIYT